MYQYVEVYTNSVIAIFIYFLGVNNTPSAVEAIVFMTYARFILNCNENPFFQNIKFSFKNFFEFSF